VRRRADQLRALSVGKYRTIVIDPPWQMDKRGGHPLRKWKTPLYDKYPSMRSDDIRKLPVGELADNECSLFLWTTHTFLRDALSFMDAWGFKYHCVITWDKGSGYTMYGFHRRTELCLFGYKARLLIKQEGRAIPTIVGDDIPDLLEEKKREHSRKPELLYKIIESKTDEPRLEMFARRKREGWDVWGNEVESDVRLGRAI